MAGDFFDFLNKIQTEYPSAVTILSQPGVMAVYQQAIDQNWPPERIQAALEATDWWKNTDSNVRQWQALQATDPATAGTKAEQTKRIIDDLQKELGINLDTAGGLNSPSFSFFTQAVANGWDANEIRYRMLSSVNATQNGGAIGAQAAQIKSMANEYGVPLSDQTVMGYARKWLEGGIDQNGVQGYLIEQAKSLFPALATALDRGITVKQYVDPYLQIAQQQLGINPSDVNLTDQKWMNLLNQVDPKTGQRVSMSLDQALATMRSDPSWGYDQTSQGRQSATQLASQLQAKFGAAA